MKINKQIKLILLILILLIAVFLRFYAIEDYIIFLGDQGRDVLIVKNIIVDKKFTLLGPTASVGGFYLGPFYYYMMILPLWIAGFNPVGPAYMVALIGVATVFLIYKFTTRLFDEKSGLLAAFLYAVSPLAVAGSRFSWNPNTVPFFTLLLFITIYSALTKKHWWLFIACGAILGINFQLHYLTLSLAPLTIILFADKNLWVWIKRIFFAVIGGLLTFSPFLLFEIRHGFNNFTTILEFVTRKSGAMGIYPTSLLSRLSELSHRIFADFIGVEKSIFVWILMYFCLIALLLNLKQVKKKLSVLLVLVWWLGGIFLLSFYQGGIYEYYFAYLYPIPAIAIALGLSFLLNQKLLLKVLSLAMLLAITYFSIKAQPILQQPNRILEQTQRIADSVAKESQNKPFNFALISGGNSDHAYRYFLEISDNKPMPLEDNVENQLFVVCESVKCEPLGNSLWEIAAFGRAEIDEEWKDEIGVRIFKLVHHPDSIDWVGKPAPKEN